MTQNFGRKHFQNFTKEKKLVGNKIKQANTSHAKVELESHTELSAVMFMLCFGHMASTMICIVLSADMTVHHTNTIITTFVTLY